MNRTMITLGAATMLWAALASAQERGTLELGAFGTYGRFDKALTLNTGLGAGGHVGMFLDPRWALEFEMSEMKATRTLGLKDVNVGILSSRLVVSPIKSGALSIQLGVGAGTSVETNFLHSYTVNGLVGLKMAFSDQVALRADLIGDWLANNDWKAAQRVQVGLSFFRAPNKETRTIEVPAAAVPCNCVQRPDSVSADEQARRRRWEQLYNALRDSLSRVPAVAPTPPPAPRRELLTLRGSVFEFDQSVLTSGAKDSLQRAVRQLAEASNVDVEIIGYTDDKGSDAYNQALSERRANAVRDFLVSQGIASGRITTSGLGEKDPVATNATAVGRALNRRVIIVAKNP
jgi:outer membrane protein OmpA-like peptidoglycan-associated protein